jgi:hypothetical protein
VDKKIKRFGEKETKKGPRRGPYSVCQQEVGLDPQFGYHKAALNVRRERDSGAEEPEGGSRSSKERLV